jgi:hypothetical protein
MTALEKRIWKRYTFRDANHQAWLTVNSRFFQIKVFGILKKNEGCDDKKEADWMRDQLAHALAEMIVELGREKR